MRHSPALETIPFFGAARAHKALQSDLQRIVMQVLASGQSLQGADVERVEQRVAQMASRRYGVAVGSATDGLFFMLKAMGVGAGDEVLVTALSFVASASCILRCGAVPVFVDVDISGHMDMEAAAAALTPKTAAILAVHLYGNMACPIRLQTFAQQHGLAILEDASQSLGARYATIPAGSIGAASVFSFDPTKVIGAPGSGGIIVTDDTKLADSARAARLHGKSGTGFTELGYNSQMSTLVAAVLNLKLDHHTEWTAKRRAIAQRFDQALAPTSARLHPVAAETFHIYHKYTFLTESRAAVSKHLEMVQIATRSHYARILPDEPVFATCIGAGLSDHFPVARRIAATTLSLPIHAFLTQDEVSRIAQALTTASA